VSRPLWIYKNNSKSSIGPSSGDWTEFFASTAAATWGSTADMGSHNRAAAFEMAPGDQVLCWQSNRRVAIGLAVVEELPESEDDHGRIEREFVLKPVEEFGPAVPLLDLRSSDPDLALVDGFRPGFVRTIYRTTGREATTLLRACGSRGVPASVSRRAQRANQDSELAAIQFVTDHYVAAGWSVVSRESEKVGYDLHATRGNRELHLEVKGTVSAEARFFLTANESERAEVDRRWRLCLVRRALDPDGRSLDVWTGQQLWSTATWRAASYRVTMEPGS
jgi:hypothetical protein